jgi:hypothetical protein
MTENIFSLESLTNTGKKVAFINFNRSIDPLNLKKKKESIVQCGQLIPLIVVDGDQITSPTDFTLIDADSGNSILKDEISNYIVIIDGQHRYKAIQELRAKKQNKEDKANAAIARYNKKVEKNSEYAKDHIRPQKYNEIVPKEIKCIYSLNQEVVINELITEINSSSIHWNNKDYIASVSSSFPNDETFQYINELANRKVGKEDEILPKNGYPIATISGLLAFNKKSISQKLLKNYLKDNTTVLPSTNINRAKKIIQTSVAVGFTEKYLAKRYFIDYIIDEVIGAGSDIDIVLGKISKLTSGTVKSIMEIGASKTSNSDIRTIIDKN